MYSCNMTRVLQHLYTHKYSCMFDESLSQNLSYKIIFTVF